MTVTLDETLNITTMITEDRLTAADYNVIDYVQKITDAEQAARIIADDMLDAKADGVALSTGVALDAQAVTITDHTVQLTALNTTVADNVTQIADLTTLTTADTARITTNANDLSQLSATVTSHGTTIADHTTLLADNTTRVGSSTTVVTGADEVIMGVCPESAINTSDGSIAVTYPMVIDAPSFGIKPEVADETALHISGIDRTIRNAKMQYTSASDLPCAATYTKTDDFTFALSDGDAVGDTIMELDLVRPDMSPDSRVSDDSRIKDITTSYVNFHVAVHWDGARTEVVPGYTPVKSICTVATITIEYWDYRYWKELDSLCPATHDQELAWRPLVTTEGLTGKDGATMDVRVPCRSYPIGEVILGWSCDSGAYVVPDYLDDGPERYRVKVEYDRASLPAGVTYMTTVKADMTLVNIGD